MSKYIDAEKLTTIIEERKAQQDQWINRYHDPINQGISNELAEILDIINSLQHESTPSKEEIADRVVDWISRNTDFFFNGDTKEVMNEIKKLI